MYKETGRASVCADLDLERRCREAGGDRRSALEPWISMGGSLSDTTAGPAKGEERSGFLLVAVRER